MSRWPSTMPAAKPCARCHETKPLEEFQHRATAKYQRGSYCLLCAREMSRIQTLAVNADPERKAVRVAWARAHHREVNLARYSITLDEYVALAEAQNECCAICGNVGLASRELVTIADRKYVLAVDHCHKDGQVRGLLCTRCNSLLGMARDSEEILMAAVRYLQRSRVKAV
jgi:Recombination endonuclease VII